MINRMYVKHDLSKYCIITSLHKVGMAQMFHLSTSKKYLRADLKLLSLQYDLRQIPHLKNIKENSSACQNYMLINCKLSIFCQIFHDYLKTAFTFQIAV